MHVVIAVEMGMQMAIIVFLPLMTAPSVVDRLVGARVLLPPSVFRSDQ